MVKLLLDKGADVNILNKSGSSPLHAALANGFTSVGDILRARGAKDLGTSSESSK